MKYINVGDVVKENQFYESYDAHFDSYLVDEQSEDRLLDYMEPLLVAGNCVVDYHSSALFPQRWFHLVIVLHANSEVLFERLTRRGYSEHKRTENLDAEISRVVADEALSSYDPSIVVERDSNTLEDQLMIVEAVQQFRARLGS